jgi:hypothetical protein
MQSASNIVQPIVQPTVGKTKAAPKPRAPAAKKTAAPKVKKSKADTEFEKLAPQEQLAFLRSKSDLLRNLEAAQEAGGSLAAPSEAAPAAVEEKAEDSDLCALRLELGSVLSREAELRSRERKLRLAIKRLQRKIIMAQSPIVCRVRESVPTEAVVMTLFNSTTVIAEKNSSATHHPVDMDVTENIHGRRNALWTLAQQSDMFDTAVAGRLLDVERDATLREHPDLPTEDSEPPADAETPIECVLEPAESVGQAPVDSAVDSELTSASPDLMVDAVDAARTDTTAVAVEQLPLVLFGQSESLYETDIYATEEQVGELDFDSATISQVLVPAPLPGKEGAEDREDPGEAALDRAPEEMVIDEPVEEAPEEAPTPAEAAIVASQTKRKGLFQNFAYTAQGPPAPAAKRPKPSAVPDPTGAAALPAQSQPASHSEVIDLTSPQPLQAGGAPCEQGASQALLGTAAADVQDLVGEDDSAGYTPECPAGVIHYLPSGGDRSKSVSASSEFGRLTTVVPEASEAADTSRLAHAPAASGHSVAAAPIAAEAAAVEESQVSGQSTSSKESDCSILSSPELPDFASMPVQKLRDILLHYGLKVDTKSKMVSLLRGMWQRLHKEGTTKATTLSKARYVQATGGRPSIASVFAPARSAPPAVQSAAPEAGGEETTSRATEAANRKKKAEEVEAAEVVAFLKSHPAWYEQVLCFVPLDLDRLHTELHAALAATAAAPSLTPHAATSQQTSAAGVSAQGARSGRRISKTRLLEVLDQHAVFVSRSGKKASQH